MASKEAPVIDQIRAHRSFLKRRAQAEEAGIDFPVTRTTPEILEGKEVGRIRLSQRAKSRYRA